MKYALIRLPLVQHAGCLPRRVIFTVVLAVVITAEIAHPQEWSILHWFDSYPEGLPVLPESQRWHTTVQSCSGQQVWVGT